MRSSGLKWKSIGNPAVGLWSPLTRKHRTMNCWNGMFPSSTKGIFRSSIYKGCRLAADCRADYICYDSVVVELTAIQELGGVEESQVINYLKATGREVGLLLNFGSKSLEYRRFVFSKSFQSV